MVDRGAEWQGSRELGGFDLLVNRKRDLNEGSKWCAVNEGRCEDA